MYKYSYVDDILDSINQIRKDDYLFKIDIGCVFQNMCLDLKDYNTMGNILKQQIYIEILAWLSA